MIGVSVLVKGTTIGTVTDFDGNYTLEVPSGKNILEISYIGYKTKEITIGNNSLINIKMEPDTQALDEVVVIGYGTVKKRDLTGAVASMKNEDVTVAPTSNVMEALQGKIAGMDIVKSSGQVGEDVSILLRGSRSIYGSNEPLFIIDGIPGSYSQVNPSDIESVDVLKDASSTAIYGSAGANGVVIITTKRGKEGKATVNFDAYYGFSGSPNYKHGMVGDEWVNYQREAYKYKNGDYPSDMSALFGNQDYTDAYNAGKWIDWIDEASGNTATTQKYSLSVSGGSEKTKIFASTSYNREEGLLSNDNLNKYSLRLNIDQEIFSWAKMGFTSNLTYQDRNQGVKNTFTKGLSSFPLGDAYDQNGKINHEYITGQYSPLGDFIEDQYVNNTRSTYLNVSGYLELSPIKDFTFTSRINGTLSDSRQGQYWGDQCNANRPSYAGSPHAAITNKNAWNYTWENILSYNTTIAKDHNIGGSVITSWNKNQNDSSLAAASGQMVDRWSFWRLASGASQHVESDFAQTQKMSFAVRFNYSYKGKYLFTFSNRWDGVSQFSAGHKWDSFPAGAIAWRISDEPFMNVAKNWLNNLKLRVGYGITGNSGGVDAYGTTTQAYVYTGNGLTLNGQNSSFTQYTGTYGSKDLGWEKSYNWNVGLDYGILNNRVDGSIEWFKTTTKGLLFKRTLPITSGLTGWGSPLSIWQNIAETSNQGVEVTINSHNIKTKDFSWTTSLNLSHNKNKIVKLADLPEFIDGNYIRKEGCSYATIYLREYAGVDPNDGRPMYYDNKEDENGNRSRNIVYDPNDADRVELKDIYPKLTGGLMNTFNYKFIDLSFNLSFHLGGYSYDGAMYALQDDGYTAQYNKSTELRRRWKQPGDITDVPRYVYGQEYGGWWNSSRGVHSTDHLRLKSLIVGVSAPQSWLRTIGINSARIYFSGTNLLTWAAYDQYDPELNGIVSYFTPPLKTFAFGLELKF